ncbi:DUF7556 family protein [Halegenticoccus soli]|uniref:DUF7556 family protein n=1 Tax=Halegenticoccus soli TaxID=1985678 RepID=UPI0018EA69AB|nr:hypothetical protein [Halegenticoccus soli]
MATDTTAANVSSPEVMASVNPSPCGDELVIADITCDDAWLSVRADDAPVLPDWR